MYKSYSIFIYEGNIEISNREGKLVRKYDENQSFRDLVDEFHKYLEDKNIKIKE